MAVNTQFAIAVHIMAGIGFCPSGETTSAKIADSVNTSHSFVRRILAKLSKAGLVSTTMGKSGSSALARPPQEISLLDIYNAVEAPKVFAIHDYPAQASCPVSCGIKSSLDRVLERSQRSVEESLLHIKLSEVLADMRG